jgi:hypothetical protein
MSYRLVNAVLSLKLTAIEKAVLIAMASHTDDNGSVCRASVATLARESGASERSVQNVLRSFERRGFIKADDPDKSGGRTLATRYVVLIPNLDMVDAIESLWNRKGAADTPIASSAKGAGDAPTGAAGAEKGAAGAPKGAGDAPESVLNRSLNRSSESTPTHTTTARVSEFFQDRQNEPIAFGKKKAELEAILAGQDGEEVFGAIAELISGGNFDKLSIPTARGNALIEMLPTTLAVRRKRAERARQEAITPDMEAQWVAQAQAKRRAEAVIELEDVRANFADTGHMLDEEQRMMMQDKIKRLEVEAQQ